MDNQLKINETNKERSQLILNRKYKFNLWYITNNNIKVFKCIKYRSINKLKHKMKNEIRKSSIPFDIKPKSIYDEISQKIGFICLEYNTIISKISRYKKKQLPLDISTFNEIPDESEYYIYEINEIL
ncbi:hypothetical protein PIROE2DRAFT_16786 [Piromyces sp. E2]|nr:hypothetical protein PIROE2DRAFT_16786 [Piromyces sp. E2]|eukprot:OUM58044.1 hypothetical protein PIROE2DRAFT_16786 [Piromyces sp. E2]